MKKPRVPSTPPSSYKLGSVQGGTPLSFRYPSKTGVLVDSLGMALVPLTCMSLVVLPPSEPVSMCR